MDESECEQLNKVIHCIKEVMYTLDKRDDVCSVGPGVSIMI